MDGPTRPSSPKVKSLTLILPAFNEEAVIEQALAEAEATLPTLADDYEILVVDDGSTDATAALVAGAAARNPRVRLCRHPANIGYGAALRSGFESASSDLVAFTDADCQFHLDDLSLLIDRASQVPVVVGRRQQRQDPPRRLFFSWGYNCLTRALLRTNVRDCDCALKVFRKEALQRLLPESKGFFVNTEMLCRARQQRLPVQEVPVRHRPRLKGASSVRLTEIPRVLSTLLRYWWTTVLFPKTTDPIEADSCPPTPPIQTAWLAAGLILLAALLSFARLGMPLQEPEEPRYAEISRQMLMAGNWAVPTLNGQEYYDKPPLLYWLVMAAYSALGAHDWAARLVPSLAMFLTIAITFAWGRAILGWRAGLLGAAMLCLSARFLYLGRLLTMNGPLCLFVTASLAAAHVAARDPRRHWKLWIAAGVSCGLGVLVKGPVAVVLLVAPLAAFHWLDARSVQMSRGSWIVLAIAILTIAGPWFAWMAASDPSFAARFFWTHNIERFLTPFDHEEPIWFFLPGVFLASFPWSLLLPSLVLFLSRRAGALARQRPAGLGFLLLASGWCVLFFSLAGCKRAGYVLPALPPLALALGWHLDWLLANLPRSANLIRLARRVALAALLAGGGGAFLAVGNGILRPGAGLGLGAACLFGLAWFLRRGPERSADFAWRSCGLTMTAVLLAGSYLAWPGYARRFSLRGQLRPTAEMAAETGLPILSYPRHWDSVSFYLRRDDVRVFRADQRQALLAEVEGRPESLLVLKANEAGEKLLKSLPANFDFLPRGRSGNVMVGLVRRRGELGPMAAQEIGQRSREASAGRSSTPGSVSSFR